MGKEKKPLRPWRDPEIAVTAKLREYKFTVLKPFRMKVRPGPLVTAEVGDQVILTDLDMIGQLFVGGRIDPIEPRVPDSAEYMVKRNLTLVINELYEKFVPEDAVKLSRDEALDLMKKGMVRPLNDETFFYIP